MKTMTGEPTSYFADCGPIVGSLLSRDIPATRIAVHAGPVSFVPVGEADLVETDDWGRSVYRLVAGGAAIPGLWAVESRKFTRVEELENGVTGPDDG